MGNRVAASIKQGVRRWTKAINLNRRHQLGKLRPTAVPQLTDFVG
jgi:hypothetical protein